MCSLGSWTEVNSRARYFGRTNQIRRRCKQTLFSGKKSYVVMWRWRKALASVEIERRTLQRPKAPFVSKTIDRFGRFERALRGNRTLGNFFRRAARPFYCSISTNQRRGFFLLFVVSIVRTRKINERKNRNKYFLYAKNLWEEKREVFWK